MFYDGGYDAGTEFTHSGRISSVKLLHDRKTGLKFDECRSKLNSKWGRNPLAVGWGKSFAENAKAYKSKYRCWSKYSRAGWRATPGPNELPPKQ